MPKKFKVAEDISYSIFKTLGENYHTIVVARFIGVLSVEKLKK